MTYTIDRLPGVLYEEEVTYELTGVGSKIPVFIGVTGNTNTNYTVTERDEITGEDVTVSKTYKVDGTEFLTYKQYSDICKSVGANGGIGTETSIVTRTRTIPATTEGGEPTTEEYDETVNNLETNILLKRIKEFYEEARLIQSGDVGVPYIYVIDVGTGTDFQAWKNAIKTAKKLHDAQVEIYVGAKVEGTGNNRKSIICGNITLASFLTMLYHGMGTNGSDDDMEEYGLKECAKNLDLRYAFTTVEGASDDDLIAVTRDFQESRIGLCEPLLFGKTMARICCTPANTEPGYYRYRSVDEGIFIPRTKHNMLQLQNNGIIFNRDEHINSNIYPKINLCVATSFRKSPMPSDALFHARFNADDLLREVFEACYNQIKKNESVTNIAYLQTRINKIVNDRVTAEEMVKYNERTEVGTKLYVSESEENPFNLVVSGQIQPVKCTIAIKVTATIKI